VTDKQHCDGLGGPTSDDETIEYVPHRQQIAAFGRLAKAEQGRLEKQLGLQDGRTPRPG
jgi:hypothetical protein